MIKGIIFDIGGVLVNDTHTLLFNLISERFNKEFHKVENAVEEAASGLELAEITEKEFCVRVANGLGISAVNELEELFGSHYTDNVKIDRWIEETDEFGIVLLSSEVGLRKPDRRFFQLVLEKLGFTPEECVFIGDIRKYVEVAEEIGIHGIHYRSCSQLEEELRGAGVSF